MRNPLVILFGLLSVVWLFYASILYKRHCPCLKALQKSASASALILVSEISQAETPLVITDTEKGFSATSPENLKFPIGNDKLNAPLPASIEQLFQRVSDHLLSHPNRLLVVTGLSTSEEQKSFSYHKKLGLARAGLVKEHLLKQGVPEQRIITKSAVKELEKHEAEVIGSIEFHFEEIDAHALEYRLRKNKMTLYFAKNKMELKLNEEQQRYFDDLKLYLAYNPRAKVMVGGHTDDKGKEEWNRRLSRKRGEFVRDYLAEHGIPFKNIDVKGHGPDQPLVPNDTPLGRKKNRRVEVTIK